MVIKINAKNITPHPSKVEHEFNEIAFALILLHYALC